MESSKIGNLDIKDIIKCKICTMSDHKRELAKVSSCDDQRFFPTESATL